ncbi:chromosome segregation protein [Microcystis phage Mwe-JY25]
MTEDLRDIPLSKLRLSPANVRREHAAADVAAMAASIRAQKQQAPIEVRPAPGSKDEFEIIDGHLRFLGLKKASGKKAATARCLVVDVDDAEARRRSLTANVVRVAMHPVDEYVAFAALVADGLSEPQVADRFGVATADVRKRLRLAALAPEVREAWRGGRLDEEQARAFAASSDLARQAQVLAQVLADKAEHARWPHYIRRAVTERMVHPSDARVAFIGGVQAYRDAGGEVEEDLFEGVTRLRDGELLERLAQQRLDAEMARLIEQGWAWVKTSRDSASWFGMRGPALEVHATPEERAALQSKDYDERQAAHEAVTARLCADPGFRARAGLIAGIGHDGALQLTGPYIAEERPEEPNPDLQDEGDGGAPPAPGGDAPADEPGAQVPHAARLALSETLTEVLAAGLKDNPRLAIAALTATLRVRLDGVGAAPLRLDPDHRRLGPSARSAASGAWHQAFAALADRSDDDVHAELAGYVARLLDLREIKFDDRDRRGWDRAACGLALAEALPAVPVKVAFREKFDAAGYFAKVPAAIIDAAGVEMTGRPFKGKKAEKVEMAAGCAAGLGWLPAELRTAHYHGPGSAAWAPRSREAAE